MSLNVTRLRELKLPDRQFTYDHSQTILYALAVGMGQDPHNRSELNFVLEPNLKVLPSQSTAIAWDYRFIEGTGIDEVMILHGAQSIRMSSPLPAAGTVVSSFRIKNVFDKGATKGAVIVAEVKLREMPTGRLICTNQWTSYARGQGGFGGERGPSKPQQKFPARAPDHCVSTRTTTTQSLLYRLLGDTNPLHADPDVAAAAGFERPIMHGLCTYGIVCRSVVVAACDHDPDRLSELDIQFSAPAYPGDTIVTDIWTDQAGVLVRAFSGERNVELATGRASLAGSSTAPAVRRSGYDNATSHDVKS